MKFKEGWTIILRALNQQEGFDSALIQIKVQNSKIGIVPAALLGLVDAFSLADGSTTYKSESTGFGMAIIKQMTKLMRGEVALKVRLALEAPLLSRLDWISLRSKWLRPTHFSLEAEKVLRYNYAGWRILIVDDESLKLEVARFILQNIGLIADTSKDTL